jgi:signal transduction histidine kinase
MSLEWDEHISHLLHDARALLRRASARTQILERRISEGAGADTAEALQGVLEAQRDLEKFLRRVAALVDASRPEAGPQLPLPTLILAAELHWKQALTDAGARIEVGAIPDVLVPNKIQHVLIELIDNSVRYRREERPLKILIEAKEVPPNVTLQVTDNGEGWDSSHSERMLRPFEKLDARKGGFGLGLAIAQAIVERAGGQLQGTPLGEGACFALTFPRALVS